VNNQTELEQLKTAAKAAWHALETARAERSARAAWADHTVRAARAAKADVAKWDVATDAALRAASRSEVALQAALAAVEVEK
jgi:GAF domain-containing protein